MLTVENFKVYNFDCAIRGLRNPLESWAKSDSHYVTVEDCELCSDTGWHNCESCQDSYRIGPNDMGLMQRLYRAGSEHAKFMRQILVSFDIVAPLYWWKEFDTYKVGTTANSGSTMHCIHKRDLTVDDFSYEHMLQLSFDSLKSTIDYINEYRRLFIGEMDAREKKKYWWQIIQLLPTSYNQRRTITANYAVLANIIKQREGHKLEEWHTFIDFILDNAPYLREITTDSKQG